MAARNVNFDKQNLFPFFLFLFSLPEQWVVVAAAFILWKTRTHKRVWPFRTVKRFPQKERQPWPTVVYSQNKISAREHGSLRGLIGMMMVLCRPQYGVRSKRVAPQW